MIHTLRAGGIEDLNVILGYEFERISGIIQDKAVQILMNENWEEGISSSIRMGLGNILPVAQEVIIFVVDQPFLSPQLIHQFISHYITHNPCILATRVRQQQCHPVLFKRKYFSELMDLEGDSGGKRVFRHHPVEYFDWHDKRVALDIDTHVDYQKYQALSDGSPSKAA